MGITEVGRESAWELGARGGNGREIKFELRFPLAIVLDLTKRSQIPQQSFNQSIVNGVLWNPFRFEVCKKSVGNGHRCILSDGHEHV